MTVNRLPAICRSTQRFEVPQRVLSMTCGPSDVAVAATGYFCRCDGALQSLASFDANPRRAIRNGLCEFADVLERRSSFLVCLGSHHDLSCYHVLCFRLFLRWTSSSERNQRISQPVKSW